MTSVKSATVAFLDEGLDTPVLMDISEELAMAVARAAYVNEGKEAFSISFNSLFIGLIATPDATGAWLSAQFEKSNADLDGLLRRRGLTRRDLDRLVKTGPTAPLPSSQGERPYKRTKSAREAFEKAEESAHAAAQVTDTAHVVAALISLPGFHDSDFKEFRINRDNWAAAFNDSPLAVQSPAGAAPDFDPRSPGVEPRVVDALRHANALAGSSPIGPSHVVTAIWNLAETIDSRAFRRFVELVPPREKPTLSSPGAAPEVTRLDEDLRRQLARAQRPKAGSAERSPVWGRDLVTAALLCADERIGPVVASAGRSLEMVRDLWYAFVTSDSNHRAAAEWAAWWREANVALPGPRRAGYSVETDKGEDKLGVDAEAHAFARLILDKDVQPPLSIGLLGDWGSGKSFFIEQIKKGVAELIEEGRPELYSQVVEIEFNAWHASDSNLWASLVTNIFDAIWENVSPPDKRRDPKAARERLQKEIEQARGAVHEAETQVQLGQQALEMAELDLKQKRDLLAWNNYVKTFASEKLRSLAKNAGWHESLETINDVQNAARALAASGNRLRTMASALLEKPLLYIATPVALLLAMTVAVWLLVDASALRAWEMPLSKTLATVAGLVGALAAPLRIARLRVDGLAKRLEWIQTKYQEKLDDVRKTDSGEAEGVERARRELESAEASVSAARARLAELLSQQATLDPQRRLGAFLQERVQSTQYRSQQGIISLVHKDFSRLSEYMKDLRESAAKKGAPGSEKDAIRPFDRIVLYVDDLDRCRPAHVVNMLEAVHLLLALDLFVVVVAVDSRWLTRSLEVYYHDLLTSGDGKGGDGLRASTPQSYLEKIFQITYALAPMDPNRFANYVAFLAGAEGEQKTPAGRTTIATPTTGMDPSEEARRRSGQTGLLTGGDSGQHRNGESKPAGQPTAAKAGRPPSAPVRIGDTERAFITQLVPLLPTPRIAKRLVNVYRVIKAGKSAEEIDAFEREGRDKTCLLMLAILFGRPGIAAELLRALHERKDPFDKSDELLIEALRRRKPPKDEPAEVRAAWDRLIGTLKAMEISESVGKCARESLEVARYSLVSGHDWHTWSNSP